MELKVSSLEDALYLIESHWPTKIISLITEDMPQHAIDQLHLRFDDIARPVGGYIHPTYGDLLRILEFAKTFTDDDNVLIHCHAGISRSTAVAISVLLHRGWTYEEAYNHIEIIRPVLSPNKLIIKYADEHFNLDGKLSKLIDDTERFPNLYYRQLIEQEE